jgi:hypothetical protein
MRELLLIKKQRHWFPTRISTPGEEAVNIVEMTTQN